MRKLNAELRQALLQTAASADADQEEELEEDSAEAREAKKLSLLPFMKRPPGGFGDEEEEEEVEREIDDSTAEDGSDEAPRPAQPAPSRSEALSTTSTAHNTLRASSVLLDRLNTSTLPTAITRLGPTSMSTSTSPSAPSSRPPPIPGVSRTPTLTFSEPTRTEARDSVSPGSGRTRWFSRKQRRKGSEGGSGGG